MATAAITFVRKPRSGKVMHNIVKAEVRKKYAEIAAEMVSTLEADVEDWVNKPEFKSKVTMGDKWKLEVRVNMRKKSGKIYKWVDEGTAENAGKGGSKYLIEPKKARRGRQAKPYLVFGVPDFPKTIPPVSGGRPTKGGGKGDQTLVRRKSVMHPGIRPRNFTKSLKDQYNGTKSGSFHALTEAAIKRGIRQIGKKR